MPAALHSNTIREALIKGFNVSKLPLKWGIYKGA
jgi:hypothetical protein